MRVLVNFIMCVKFVLLVAMSAWMCCVPSGVPSSYLMDCRAARAGLSS